MPAKKKYITPEYLLIEAVKRSKLNKVKELVEVNKANINSVDKVGWTPLMWSCWLGNKKIVKFLITKKANVLIKDRYGITAIKLADKEYIKKLLEENKWRL
jgi:ankyrin repeat protein